MLFSRAIALSILAFLLGTKCLHPWGILSSILVFYMTNVVVILYIQNPSPLNKENMLTKILIPVTTSLSSLLSVCLYLGIMSPIRCLVFHSLVSFLSFTSLHTKILSNGAYFSKSHYYCMTPQCFICYSLALKYAFKAHGSVLGLQLKVLLGGDKTFRTGAEEEGWGHQWQATWRNIWT